MLTPISIVKGQLILGYSFYGWIKFTYDATSHWTSEVVWLWFSLVILIIFRKLFILHRVFLFFFLKVILAYFLWVLDPFVYIWSFCLYFTFVYISLLFIFDPFVYIWSFCLYFTILLCFTVEIIGFLLLFIPQFFHPFYVFGFDSGSK